MIKAFDFGRIVSSKKVKDSGLGMGDVVLVMGTRVVPASRKDPYLNRTLVVVSKVEGGLIQIPKDNNNYKAYLIDPRSLEKIEGEEFDKLNEEREKQFGG